MDPTRARATIVSDRLLAVALVIAALAPYAGTLAFGYVMDDTTAIRSNPDMNGWDSLWKVWAHPFGGEKSPFFGLYRPLTMALFAFVWNAGGHWALWFHLLAIVLHAVATVLVWRLVARACARIPAFLAALWFAVHPVHVEAVASVANSSEILVAIWTCALALHLGRAAGAPRVITWRPALGAALLYAAAFLSKESGAVAPALAVLWVWSITPRETSDSAFHAADFGRRWWRVGVAWLAVAVAVFTVRAFVLGGPVSGDPIGAPGLLELSAPERVWAMLSLVPRTIQLLVWPSGLNPHYGPTAFPANRDLFAALSVLAIALVSLFAVRLARRGDRRPLMGLAWMAAAFLPASNLLVPTGQILAERTLYVPSIGMAMLLAWALDALWSRASAVGSAQPGWRLLRTAALAAVVVTTLEAALRTARWKEVWRNHPALFAQIIAADSAGYRGYWLSGLEARNTGRMDDALTLLGRAYTLYPRDRGLMIDYSETLLHANQAPRAAAVAEGLVASRYRGRPYDIALYLNAVLKAYGADSVVAAGGRLMDQTPSATAALFVGFAQEARGDRAAALDAYERGLRIAPADSALQLRVRTLRVAR